MNRRTLAHALCAVMALSCAGSPAWCADDALLVFVGRKLKVETFELPGCKERLGRQKPASGTETVCIDLYFHAVHAEYQVLKWIHGWQDGATIRFDALDHYGPPPFANHEYALLYVSRAEDGRLYQVRYQYAPVYETVDGGWAGCGVTRRSADPGTAAPLVFKNAVALPLTQLSATELATWRESPAWEFKGQQAICRMSISAEELFENWQRRMSQTDRGAR